MPHGSFAVLARFALRPFEELETYTKNLNVGAAFILVGCVADLGYASAQAVRHGKMDARAARADMAKLRGDRRIARKQHNWAKVKQDNRLIADDMKFVHKDHRKIVRSCY